MKIAYTAMWSNFNLEDNWFNEMFKDYFHDDSIEFGADLTGADIVFSSVFGPQPIIGNGARRIFWTGESRKNGYTPDQILLGFDKTDIGGMKFRLPLWYVFINWWPDKFYPPHDVGGPTHIVDIDYMSREREVYEVSDILNRPGFCSMVVSNGTPHRVEAFERLMEIGPVEGWGNMFGHMYPGSKIDLLGRTRFNACFENTISPGYVTEKLFEAGLAGCIPIYWGDDTARDDFNPAAFIHHRGTMDELIDEVRKVNGSNQAMIEMASHPFFLRRPSLEPLYSFFDSVKLK